MLDDAWRKGPSYFSQSLSTRSPNPSSFEPHNRGLATFSVANLVLGSIEFFHASVRGKRHVATIASGEDAAKIRPTAVFSTYASQSFIAVE